MRCRSRSTPTVTSTPRLRTSRSAFWRIGSVALLAGFVASGAAAQEPSLAAQRAEHVTALYAKLLCSGLFVVGRDAQEFIDNNLQRPGPGTPKWEDIDVDIDYDAKRVTLQTDDLPARTAVYTGDQGCVLLARGMKEIQFEPVQFEPNLPPADTTPWPMGDRISPSRKPDGVDTEGLDAALDFAFDDSLHDPPQHTRAMVVVYQGEIVGERYAPGFDKDTRHISWSMGKSITAALIGLLVGEGHFEVDDPAPIAEWHGADDPRGAIRIAHLLRMSSGLDFHTGGVDDGLIYTNKDNHRYVYFGAPNVFEYSIQRDLEFPPNTVWRYRNCDPLSLGKIVRDTVEAEGREYLTYPQRALFDKIGMRRMVLETDPYGNFIMTGYDYGTARDWARFGLLHLWDGVWMGERILPEGWVKFIRTPAPANEHKAYGGQFWLNAGGSRPSLPKDAFWPAGHHGQNVIIIPSRDTVIVRMGHSYLGGFDGYMDAVAGRVISAISAE